MGKNTTCKQCSRRFTNPRALAGHMRSHSLTAVKSPSQPQPQLSSTSSNAKKRLFLEEQDGDMISETSSPSPSPSPSPSSSVSVETTPEVEDVALSLMMLSRDFWPTRPKSSEIGPTNSLPAAKRGRHQCGACKKVFKSYQALGGHRAATQRRGSRSSNCCLAETQTHMLETNGWEKEEGEDEKQQQQHVCPYCSRVFVSGQALGGHKRTHFCAGAAVAVGSCGGVTGDVDPMQVNEKKSFDIDLNLPAPVDDDFEVSVVSDCNYQLKK